MVASIDHGLLRNLTVSNIVITTTTLLIVRFFLLSIYRVFFHPNRNIPGPLLGRITNLYEYYHEIWKGEGGELNKYAREVLHPKYGPIIRTAPNVVRISDKDAWFQIHSVGYSFNVDPAFASSFGNGKSFFAHPDTDYHRKTRQILTPHFTKKAVLEVEDQIHEKNNQFKEILRGLAKAGDSGRALVNFHAAYTCCLTDFITEYVFETNWNTMKAPGFHHPIADLNHLELPTIRRIWPNLMGEISKNLPEWIAKRIVPPALAGVIFLRNRIAEKVKEFSEGKEYKRDATEIPHWQTGEDPGMTSGNVGNGITRKLVGKMSFDQLAVETALFLGAGVNSTHWTLCAILYGITATEGVQERLAAELKAAFPGRDDKLDYKRLIELPYLTACIKEGMRFRPAVQGRLPRVAPRTGATILGYKVAPNTVVETSISMTHFNPEIFPSPQKFIPERWIPSETPFPQTVDNLDKYLITFGSGSRMCLGYHQAWMFLYIDTALVLREFEVELGEGLKRDGDWLGADRWVSGKRGDPGHFWIKSRED